MMILRDQALHNRKIQGYTSIGYEVIVDNGHSATLVYVPYSQQYVKLAEVENGKTKNSIALSVKELKALNSRLGMSAHALRKKNRK